VSHQSAAELKADPRSTTVSVPAKSQRKRVWDCYGRNEKVHGGPAIRRTELPGSFKRRPSTHAMAKKAERHGHQRLEHMVKPLHERVHRTERMFIDASSATGQFDRTEVDVRRHQRAERPVNRGVSGSMRKGEQAAPNARALIPKWNPFIQCHLDPLH